MVAAVVRRDFPQIKRGKSCSQFAHTLPQFGHGVKPDFLAARASHPCVSGLARQPRTHGRDARATTKVHSRSEDLLCGFHFGGCYNLKMTPDPDLLRQFAQTNSEAAFAELVKRHVNLVYSAALRQVNGDAHSANDVAQMVFTDLARKADSLAHRESLTGWLYTSAHFAATKMVRGENRRRDRE